MNISRFAPILAAKTLSLDELELIADDADLVYVIKQDGARYVAYRIGSNYGFIGERDEMKFTDEATMLAAFEAMVHSMING